MQRKTQSTKKSPYIRSGVDAQDTPGGKKRSPIPAILRRIIFIAIILSVVVAVVIGANWVIGNTQNLVRISARPTDNIQPFGEDVLFYDGMTLHCVSPTGASKWYYSLGPGGDFHCSNSMVVAWSGNLLIVFNKDGQPTYTTNMEETIRFARVGEAYIAACIGASETKTSIRVMTLSGSHLENIDMADLFPLDIGFFYSKGQLMWVLSLDVNGNAPITNLASYEPGKLATGKVELQDELVYKVYVNNNNLMVADTSRLRTFNYKCVEQTDLASTLIYGWQVKQVRTVSTRNSYALLEQLPASGDLSSFSEIRVLNQNQNNTTMTSIRLLTPCFASGLGDKGVYGFGPMTIYYAPYGTKNPRPTQLSYTITDFICMLEGNRAVLVAGSDVFIQKLPTK